MHIHFAGIGGTGIGPLAIIAKQAGFTVSGSNNIDSEYVSYVKKQGIEVFNEDDGQYLTELHKKTPIDWLVYSSALPKENAKHPVIEFTKQNSIKSSKRDEFLAHLIKEKNLKLLAIAGTHGKTTTTAMVVWLFKQLGLPISYSVGAKLSYGEMGEFDAKSEYFAYECDEYDHNFLSFSPYISIISGIAYDHPDIYPTKKSYNEAFNSFIGQSDWTIIWENDAKALDLAEAPNIYQVSETPFGLASITLPGEVNRRNARLAIQAVAEIVDVEFDKLIEIINKFPGLSRRFEQIAKSIYSDYAHTPEKIVGALQMAHEVAGNKVVVVYEGLHNTRQHFIAKQLKAMFSGVKKLYVVPSYRAREDESLEDLTPQKLCDLMNKPESREPAELKQKLKDSIASHVKNGDLVICLTAGGGKSLDEWLRKEFAS